MNLAPAAGPLSARNARRLRTLCYILGALIPIGWLLAYRDAPLVADALLWHVPGAFQQAASGPSLVTSGPLPGAVLVEGAPVPAQWAGGLPDQAHPPLWYLWLALFLAAGATLDAVRVACVLPGVWIGLGFVALADHHRRPWAGLLVWAVPGVLAQLLRPELDLGLLCCVPWALLALQRQQMWTFGVLAALATWIKEPGVLLVVPGLVAAVSRRRGLVPALLPLLGLAAWAALNEGLAALMEPPDSATEFFQNIMDVLSFIWVEQGRFLLIFALLGGGLTALRLELALALAFCVFFACVRYQANEGTEHASNHLRYLLPAVAVWVVGSSARLRAPLALLQLFFLHRLHGGGPAVSMTGIDAAYADRAALEAMTPGTRVWVGSDVAAGIGRPWSGFPSMPVRVYDFYTQPGQLEVGDRLLISSFGEPATRLARSLRLEHELTWTVAEVRSQVYVVTGQEPGAWAPAVGGPR